MFLFAAEQMAELHSELRDSRSSTPRPDSDLKRAVSYLIVATYHKDDFGYIIRRSSTEEYQFVYFCAGERDTVSVGYASKQEAIHQAYRDSRSRGIDPGELEEMPVVGNYLQGNYSYGEPELSLRFDEFDRELIGGDDLPEYLYEYF